MSKVFIAPLAVGLLAGLLSVLITPLVIKVARRFKWFDPTNDRKIHTGQISRLGGVAMFLSFDLSLLIFYLAGGRSEEPALLTIVPLLTCAAAIHFVGLADDFKNLRALFKLAWQIAVSMAMIMLGYRFRSLPLPWGILDLGWFSYPLTLVWIVGIMNAVNMIDGMDGMAGGISIIAAFSFGVAYLGLGLRWPATASLALVGAISGFLVFNFPKAKIFMGDSGSLFLGFLLAILPLLHKSVFPKEAGILSAITVLLIPIYDVFAAILRRRRRGQSIMMADREHLHHKLMDLGFETRQILAIVYAACMGLGGIAILGSKIAFNVFFWLVMTAWIVLAGWFLYLHFHRKRKGGNFISKNKISEAESASSG
jgi:UDP-GlcNAc:undecaprenyl-phosphate GlcNAc-1-phosphate transferase